MGVDIHLSKTYLCPHCAEEINNDHEDFEALDTYSYSTGTTYNLRAMAKELGIEDVIFGDTYNGHLAGELVPRLEDAVSKLGKSPKKYKEYDAENGWGTYEDFLNILTGLLEACVRYSDSTYTVWR